MHHLHISASLSFSVTTGNNIDEILKVLSQLSPAFSQTVVLGYPPFVKGVVDKGLSMTMDFSAYRLHFVLAGEV